MICENPFWWGCMIIFHIYIIMDHYGSLVGVYLPSNIEPGDGGRSSLEGSFNDMGRGQGLSLKIVSKPGSTMAAFFSPSARCSKTQKKPSYFWFLYGKIWGIDMTWYSWSSNCIGVMGHYFGYKISNRKVLVKPQVKLACNKLRAEGMPFGVDRKTSWARKLWVGMAWLKTKNWELCWSFGNRFQKRLTEWNNISVDGKESIERWAFWKQNRQHWWEHSSFWHNRWSTVVFFLAKQPGIYDSPGRPGNDEVFGNPSPWRLKISREMKIHPKLGGGFKYIYPYFLKIPILTIWLMFFRWVVQPPTRYPICFPMLVIGTSIPIFRWWKFPWDKSRIPAANFTEAHWIYWSPRFF